MTKRHDERNEPLAELTAQLKPVEELEDHRADTELLEGAIRVDDRVPIPNGVIEPESKRSGVDFVVLMIALLMLVFIAFIAWQISLMPGPAKP
jgi:hypothetical protein